MSDEWLSIIEYARRFNVSDMTVRRRIKTGRLEAVLKEGKYYIPVNQNNKRHERVEPERVVNQYQKPWQRDIVIEKSYHPQGFEQAQVHPKPTYSSPIKNDSSLSVNRNDDFQDRYKENTYANKLPSGYKLEKVIDTCEAMLTKLENGKEELELRYQAETDLLKQKIDTLEAKLQEKEVKVSQLSQEVEDLQLLVSMMEKKKRS